MNNQELMSVYGTIADITDKMVDAAKKSDWTLLAKLEIIYSKHVQRIKDDGDMPVRLAENEREVKVRVINKILADDRQLHDIIQPRMIQLGKLLHRSSTQLKLNRTYLSEQR